MKQRDVLVLMDGIAPAVAGLLGKAMAPIVARLQEVEKQLADARAELAALVPAPEPGKSVTLDDVRPLVEDLVAGAFATVPVPENGKDADPEVLRALVLAEVEKAIAARPPAPTAEEVAALVPKVPTAEEIAALIPTPTDGADGAPGRDGNDGQTGRDGPPGEKGDPGRDGADVADALIDRDGALVVTLTNGAVKRLGVVVGKDGESGKPGIDGLGFDDLEVIDDGMTFTLRLQRGDHVKEWTLAKPTLADMHKGVWREGDYVRGSIVTWGGSLWMAKADTSAKPEADESWVLVTKRGRDGKDGEAPKPPPVVKLK